MVLKSGFGVRNHQAPPLIFGGPQHVRTPDVLSSHGPAPRSHVMNCLPCTQDLPQSGERGRRLGGPEDPDRGGTVFSDRGFVRGGKKRKKEYKGKSLFLLF